MGTEGNQERIIEMKFAEILLMLGIGLVVGFIYGFNMGFRGVWEYGVRKGKAVKIGKMFFWKDDIEPIEQMEGGDEPELSKWTPIVTECQVCNKRLPVPTSRADAICTKCQHEGLCEEIDS